MYYSSAALPEGGAALGFFHGWRITGFYWIIKRFSVCKVVQHRLPDVRQLRFWEEQDGTDLDHLARFDVAGGKYALAGVPDGAT